MTFRYRALIGACAFILSAYRLTACSVLSHEAIIDALWDVKIKPLLLAHYPNLTREQLKAAHGFAYGGSIVQDLGYYPHGSKQFSDLAHYVRTGNFMEALIGEAHDANELAFAYGALSHYISDIDVHSHATNIGEPMLYPHLRKKFGSVISYEQAPTAHLETEFAFDVLEVARGNYAPQAYHDFIGFSIAPGVLDRALQATFAIGLKELFPDFDRSIGSYRRDISKLIPKATRIAWAQRQEDIQKAQRGVTYRRFVYVMSRSSYERNWGKQYDRPSAGERFLAVILKLLPPIGPLRDLKLRMPTPEVENLFMAAFDLAVHDTAVDLNAAQNPNVHYDDINYDLGVRTQPGQYRLEDDSYADWLDHLARKNFAGVTPAMRDDIFDYYKNPESPIDTKRHRKKWMQVQDQLAALKSATIPASPVAQGAP